MDLQIADRVAVVVGDSVKKGRVATLPGFGKVGITLSKHDKTAKIYQISDVLPLYRYEKKGPIMTPIGEMTAEVIVPLMVMK